MKVRKRCIDAQENNNAKLPAPWAVSSKSFGWNLIRIVQFTVLPNFLISEFFIRDIYYPLFIFRLNFQFFILILII